MENSKKWKLTYYNKCQNSGKFKFVVQEFDKSGCPMPHNVYSFQTKVRAMQMAWAIVKGGGNCSVYEELAFCINVAKGE